MSDVDMDSAARRAAKRVGLEARKNRMGPSLDNFGGYQLVDPALNAVIAGPRFELTATAVIEYCLGKESTLPPDEAP